MKSQYLDIIVKRFSGSHTEDRFAWDQFFSLAHIQPKADTSNNHNYSDEELHIFL